MLKFILLILVFLMCSCGFEFGGSSEHKKDPMREVKNRPPGKMYRVGVDENGKRTLRLVFVPIQDEEEFE